MGVLTTLLKLLKPSENDYYNQQTEQADNWDKVDNYAVLTNTDKNAIWGGLDGGGLIEDPSVTKVVGKRYIGADGKAYICLVPSNINNSTNYTPCNTVDNLQKIKEFSIDYVITNATSFQFDFTKYDFFIVKGNWYGALGTIVGGTSILNIGEQEISGIGLDSNMQQAGFHIKRLSGEDSKPTFGEFKKIGTCDSFAVYGVKIRIV